MGSLTLVIATDTEERHSAHLINRRCEVDRHCRTCQADPSVDATPDRLRGPVPVTTHVAVDPGKTTAPAAGSLAHDSQPIPPA